MKKYLMFVFTFLFLINFVSAISVDLKETYKPRETIIIEISGNILSPIIKDQIEFKKNNVRVPFDYDVKKLGDRYFLWAIAKDTLGNYTILINDITTTISGNLGKINFQQNFEIKGNLSSYTIKPGFLYITKDVSLALILNKDKNKKITTSLSSKQEIDLKPGENIIKISTSEFEKSGLTILSIGNYSVPAYVIKKASLITNKTANLNEQPKIRINPKEIISNAFITSEIYYPFFIINYGTNEVKNISINYNHELFNLTVDNLNLSPKDVKLINISFIGGITDNLKNNGIQEKIFIKAFNLSLELPIKISFTENKSEARTPYLEKNKEILYYCSELDGGICLDNDVCEGEIRKTFDGDCCVGKCKKNTKNFSWIGWIIVLFIIIIILLVYIKYSRTKSKKRNKKIKINSLILN